MEEDLEPEEENIDEDNQIGAYERGYGSEEEYSRLNEVVQKIDDADLQELFDQKVLKQYYEEPKDKEIAEFDLP